MPAKPTHKKRKRGARATPLPPAPLQSKPLQSNSLTTFILIVSPPQRQKGRGNAGRAPEGNNIAGMARSYREIRHLRIGVGRTG